MMNLAIIGASYLQLPLIEKAREMGYTTHVFAWAANDVGERAADHFYPVSIVEKDEILRICRDIGICGVCSIASDLAATTVNYVAHHLGLPGNSPECTRKSTNKYLMRKAFAEGNDPSPACILVDDVSRIDMTGLHYPVIVKPTDRSGSRGICKVEKAEDLEAAVRSAITQGFEKKALIEEFAEGEEYSVEAISCRGIHHILAVTLKYTTGAPHFIETGHMEPAPVSGELYQKIVEIVTHALDTLGIQNSASHSEIKIDGEEKIRIIEIGGRMGGDCIGSDLVYYSTGTDFLRAVIDVACGKEPDLQPVIRPCPVEVRYILSEEDVREYEEIKKTDRFIRTVFFRPEEVGDVTDSSNRAGCYLIRAVYT